ncbi:MAG: hypothetical protein AB8G77_07550 [Rhodothermales bacterium]
MADGIGQIEAPYSEKQTMRWLVWLARSMQQHGQTVFLIEQLQPNWLATRRQRWLHLFCSSILFSLVIGVMLYSTWILAAQLDPRTISIPTNAIISGHYLFFLLWIAMTLWNLFAGSIEMGYIAWLANRAEDHKWKKYQKIAARFFLLYTCWIVIWAGIWVVTSLMVSVSSDEWNTLKMLRHPWLGGSIVVMIYMGRFGKNHIGTVEALGWSWSRAGVWSLAGLALSLGAWLVYWGQSTDLPFGLIVKNLLLYPPLGIVVGFLLGGLTFRVTQLNTAPNQGIRLSIHNMLLAGPLIGVLMSLVFWMIFRFGPLGENGQMYAISGTLVFGFTSLLGAMLWYGGFDALRHYVLRGGLLLTGVLPLNLVHFLDYAANDLHFLQKVGGGYIFIHRYMLEHFAAMELPEASGLPVTEETKKLS